MSLTATSHQTELFGPPPGRAFDKVPASTCLETDFPIETVSLLAEKESWRKEIHRPATHTHKWWAQRLGSVFRAILLGAVSSEADEVTTGLSTASSLEGLVVYDPFAGSGTTLVEAAKVDARCIGRDINPVASLVQRQAVADWDFGEIENLYKEIEHECRDDVLELYTASGGDTVLYFFWVALASCPDCDQQVELFSNRAFARHAYVRRHPQAQSISPCCNRIITVDLSVDQSIRCDSCGTTSPLQGPVKGQWVTCSRGHRNRVVDALAGQRPQYRPYAKLVADEAGDKRYERIDGHDLELFDEAGRRLRQERAALVLPEGTLEDGYNTRQALRWGFSDWSQLFNDRQLYCLGRIGRAVRDLTPSGPEREALATLFSGITEFNNMFCSYKGEGTGAVRHIFSHHILRPERTPLEANPWGTPLSSGAFSTLFNRRLRRANEYKANPHDLSLVDSEPRRVFGISKSTAGEIATSYEDFKAGSARFYVATGDSADTDLPDNSVDLVITDPPFMDNVHYSELADFFHAWLRGVHPFPGYASVGTTRHRSEVQSTDPAAFGSAITSVFRECSRVLRQKGLMAFTFHQARIEGWQELIGALRDAQFVVTALQPVKAEMSVSATKVGATDPSNLDSIVVCRKRPASPIASSSEAAAALAVNRLYRLQAVGTNVSKTDVDSVVGGSVLSLHTADGSDDLTALSESAASLTEKAVLDLGL